MATNTTIAYDISDNFTFSLSDLEFDLISINATAVKTGTLPDACAGLKAFLTNSNASNALTINKPDASALIVLAPLATCFIYVYTDASGVEQWAAGVPSSTSGDILWYDTETYTISNVTTDRSYDANATTMDELADTLGTLIADLRAKGIVL